MSLDNDSVVEQRIRAAAERGAFDDLPGAGQPLPPDDAEMVPAELRVAYRLLKNAGYAPPEVDHRKSIAALEQAIACDGEEGTLDAQARASALRRLALLRAQISGDRITSAETDYRHKLMDKLSGSNKANNS